jgi:hypothetical protein
MKNLVQRKLTCLCLSLFSHHQSSLCFSNSNDFINFLIFGFNLIEIVWVWFKIQFNKFWWRLIKRKLNWIWLNWKLPLNFTTCDWNSIHFILGSIEKMVNLNLNLKSNSTQFSWINFNLVKLNWMLLNWILWVESISWKLRKHSHQMVDFLENYYHEVKNFFICSKMKGAFFLFILSWAKKCVDIMKCQQFLSMVIK